MILTIIFLILALAAFLVGCVVAASDAQGAIFFIFVIPVVLGLLGYNIYWSRKNFKRVINVISISGFIFTTLFVVFAFVPGLNLFPATVVGFVARGFEAVTGKTPYAWTRERNDIVMHVNRDLKTPEELNMSEYTVSKDWHRVCFETKEVTNTLTFFYEDTEVYKLEYPKSLAEFGKLNGKCIPKAKARFVEQKKGSKDYIELTHP